MDYKEKIIALLNDKELSQEQKEKLEYIFPELNESELKESEDERVRKALVRFHKSTIDIDGIKGADILAWLEKKGQPKPNLPKWKYKKDNTPLLRDSIILNKYGGVAKSPSGAIVSDVWVLDYDELTKLPKEELEKQGEQKPADKVEPKFHEGEWIVWKNKCYKVNYNGCGYELIDQNGLSTSLEYGTVDENAHLWDITKDAKDGDVLVDKSDGTIGIFESIGHHPDGGSFNDPSYCFLHCRYDDEYFFADFEDGNIMTSYDVIPATKEQRDLLFAKMKEAGYEWNAEKKELKKIHVIDDGKAEMDYCFTKMMAGEKVSPAWSEEDEEMLENVISSINHDSIIEGLKSRGISYSIDSSKRLMKNLIDWLKSLKERITWKPSKEQMEALDDALNERGFDYNYLNSLYEQLKKL